MRETADDVRIYIIYGHSDTHLGNWKIPKKYQPWLTQSNPGLLEALQLHGSLETNKYFVVGLLDGIWDRGDPGKYMRGVLEVRTEHQRPTELTSLGTVQAHQRGDKAGLQPLPRHHDVRSTAILQELHQVNTNKWFILIKTYSWHDIAFMYHGHRYLYVMYGFNGPLWSQRTKVEQNLLNKSFKGTHPRNDSKPLKICQAFTELKRPTQNPRYVFESCLRVSFFFVLLLRAF